MHIVVVLNKERHKGFTATCTDMSPVPKTAHSHCQKITDCLCCQTDTFTEGVYLRRELQQGCVRLLLSTDFTCCIPISGNKAFKILRILTHHFIVNCS